MLPKISLQIRHSNSRKKMSSLTPILGRHQAPIKTYISDTLEYFLRNNVLSPNILVPTDASPRVKACIGSARSTMGGEARVQRHNKPPAKTINEGAP